MLDGVLPSGARDLILAVATAFTFGAMVTEAPVADVVAKIRELNQLDTTALDAGQTLIAPIA